MTCRFVIVHFSKKLKIELRSNLGLHVYLSFFFGNLKKDKSGLLDCRFEHLMAEQWADEVFEDDIFGENSQQHPNHCTSKKNVQSECIAQTRAAVFSSNGNFAYLKWLPSARTTYYAKSAEWAILRLRRFRIFGANCRFCTSKRSTVSVCKRHLLCIGRCNIAENLLFVRLWREFIVNAMCTSTIKVRVSKLEFRLFVELWTCISKSAFASLRFKSRHSWIRHPSKEVHTSIKMKKLSKKVITKTYHFKLWISKVGHRIIIIIMWIYIAQ